MAENEEGKVIVDQPAFNKEVELAHLMEIVHPIWMIKIVTTLCGLLK